MGSALVGLAFILIVLQEMGRAATAEPSDWHPEGPILTGTAYWGIVLLVISEALSLFHALRWSYLTLAWLAVSAFCFAYGYRRRLFYKGIQRCIELTRRWGGVDRTIFVGFSILALVVLSVAIVSPPNNIDALQYHMPRVLHWAQNGSLDHFATPHDSENARPYWAELVILNLRVLWGSDRPANLPQAFSLLGVVLASVGICRQLGGDRRALWLAGAFAFSVPMSLLQATTPKNDVVSSFWVLTTAYFVTRESRQALTGRERWALFASVGLAMLTKGTGIPFVAGLLLWYFVLRIIRRGLLKSVAETAPTLLLIALIHAPFWFRNFSTYGGPYGARLPLSLPRLAALTSTRAAGDASADSQETVARQAAPTGIDLRIASQSAQPAPGSGLGQYLSRVVRMLAMHFVTPIHVVNEAIFRGMRRFPGIFSDQYVESLELVAWNNEMTAGNPLHLVLIAGSFVVLGLDRKRRVWDSVRVYSAIAAAGLFLISFSGCIDVIYCMRYQLSFFLLGASVVAVVVFRLAPRWTTVAAGLLLAYSTPYVLLNNMRPVIGMPPWPTRIGSVYTTDQLTILFAQSPMIRDEEEYVTARVREEGCRGVGLGTAYLDLEYPFWSLLGAPESGVVIEHLLATADTQKYLDPGFSPCAVICTACDGLPPGMDLPLESDFGHVRLYLRPSP